MRYADANRVVGTGLMSAATFEDWCRGLHLSEACRAMISRVRSSPPSRRVGNGAGNVCGFYPSAKMGQTIGFESHRNELAAIYEYEHDPDVLEYWDQPERFTIHYEDRNGRAIGHPHTPDFLVLRRDGAAFEECKPEERLHELAVRSPNRYVRRADGTWVCPPGEAHAATLGLQYRLRSSGGIDWVFQRNMIFLEDYLRGNTPAVDPETAGRVLAMVRDRPGLTLADLAASAEGIGRDVLHILIVTDAIHADLHAAPLAEPERVRLFRDRTTAAAYRIVEDQARPASDAPTPTLLALPGANVLWDERAYTIVNIGAARIVLQPPEGDLVRLSRQSFENLLKAGEMTAVHAPVDNGTDDVMLDVLAGASKEEFAEANRRYGIIEPLLRATALPDDLPLPIGAPVIRTVRRWIAAYRQAEATCGCGYAGLLPGWGRRGNRLRKLPQETLALMDRLIREQHETIRGKVAERVYGAVVSECERLGLCVPSNATFHRAVRRRPRHHQISSREGRRAAYRHEIRYLELSLTTPRHGERPFEVCHIDHTQLDIELVCSRTGVNLGRPWMTLLVDAFSRRVLAVFITFDEPSYRSCMMVLRLCVQRHGRLPQIIVVDNGADFRSVWFDTVLARHRITKKLRPPAKARFGSVCERLVGTGNTQFVHNLLGNTRVMRNVRQVTKSVDPRGLACWTLGLFYESLIAYWYGQYDTTDHPALGDSPRAAFTRGMELGGERAHLLVPYDETFRMLMLPTTRTGRSKVQPGNGVKINHNYYWTDEFRNPDIENTRVPVRYDPFDSGTAWAFVGKRWLKCVSGYYPAFRGRSEKEIMLATAQLRKLRQRHSGRVVISARALADFLGSVEARESLLPQRAKDDALGEVMAVIGGRPAPLPVDDATTLPPAPGPEGDAPVATASIWATATTPDNLPDFEAF